MPKAKWNLNTIYISERLQESLRPISRCTLTTVVAPMGYGKTTAVEWYLAERARAEEISVVNSHVRPDGSKCFTVLKDYGVTDTPTGENAAWGSVSPEEVVNAWMNSEGHRANILNPEARKMSVGYYYNSNSTWGHQWIQIFTK